MKKTIAIILALMLSLSLFACGAQNGGDGGGGIQPVSYTHLMDYSGGTLLVRRNELARDIGEPER